jgi:hypothetical protein
MGSDPERPAFSEIDRAGVAVNPKNFFAELKRRNVYKVTFVVRSCRVAPYSGRHPSLSLLRNSELGRAVGCACNSSRFSNRRPHDSLKKFA